MGAATEFIAAIELSSSKIAGIAGRKNSDGSLQVLAYAKEESSSFIRKGAIFNMDKAALALTSIINKLEATLQNSIKKVYVGVSGQSMHTVMNTVGRDYLEETIITQEEVDAICDENHAIPLVDMDILEVAPQEYKVGYNYQVDPVGVAAQHIEGRFLNIVAKANIKKYLIQSFDKAKIEIADLLIAPLATADQVLIENEKRSGCALVDFGADTTTVSVYKNNILRFLSVIPLGGNSITHDITALQMEEEEAEYLKVQYGDATYEEPEGEEVAAITLEDNSQSIRLSTLNDIIEARMEEIIANVWNQIEYSNYDDKLLAGVILTGGGANLKNTEEFFRKQTKVRKVRTARFVRNEVDDAENLIAKDCTQNTLLGLLASGNDNCCAEKQVEQPTPSQPISGDMFSQDEDLKRQAEEARKRIAEEERKAKEEEKKRKQEEKRNRPSWLKSTFTKISNSANDLFSDDENNFK
ncbi:cell division protein FtsA [Bacteroides sp. 224]|uniref:cell division protein FtsA n=1 Tax=Bacteroides sp. 224 TaxID=2302936 RepID=UPI0013D7489C|nr:cell division protein FtsA [Bacteroides sp. 224]NDV64239.1 cell division protein FtsA [Bacteroides sp. 224]